MRTLIAATDLTKRSDVAVGRAVRLCGRGERALTLLHVVDDELPEPLRAHERRDALDLLEAAVEKADAEVGAAISVEVRTGTVETEIAAAVERLGADLLVTGAPRRRPLMDALRGTTVERVVNLGPAPVLVVRAPPEAEYRRVLWATDFSEPSDRAAQAWRTLGGDARPSATALHVVDAPARGLLLRSNMPLARTDQYEMEEEAQGRARLKQVLRAVGDETMSPVVVTARTSAADAVLDYAAAEACDLVVIGARGAGGLRRFILGGVTEEVLRRATCDVLVVP